uniref:chitinase n=1 Tax=Fusarium oxysporum (strain Fo5176) TaxID=660025 RepID=A0A0C4DIB2_FUSOF
MAVAILFLCLATLANAETNRQLHGTRSRHHRRSNVITKAPAWAKEITNSPGHQNPAMAPPDPTVELELSDDSATSLDQYYKDAENATESSDVTPNKSHLSRRSLEKRGSGPLYCKDGPCADDSCCGPEKICGYGPDYCGEGCSSNCDATAMCGEYSEEGEMPCGMNLCCSASGWCGTTEVFCDNADPVHKTLPCQAGYGSCNIASSPSCAKGSGSTNGRTIGYYQSWNVRARKCDTKTPKQLNTKGFTHLFYSFAFIDPVSFKVTPAHDDDVKQMREFTDLSKDVRAYMDEYGFQGVDLDWEYPGEPKRGGRKLADTRNFSMLLKEMRAAYGSKYGISLTLAPDYWYLSLISTVTGTRMSRLLAKSSAVKPIFEKSVNNTIPLWFGGLDPKKLNFGLALYGRGYTVADKSCNNLGCSFVGPSKKGECTDSDGVMSLGEIKNLIKKGVKSTYLKDSMMKQITFDDQWIGYDDEETFADKKAWADGYCFGGTMIWSIDFQPSDNSTLVPFLSSVSTSN